MKLAAASSRPNGAKVRLTQQWWEASWSEGLLQAFSLPQLRPTMAVFRKIQEMKANSRLPRLNCKSGCALPRNISGLEAVLVVGSVDTLTG